MSVFPVTVCGMALSIGMVTIDCLDPQSLAALNTGLGCEVRHAFICLYVLRSAVRIPGVINRVHAYKDV